MTTYRRCPNCNSEYAGSRIACPFCGSVLWGKIIIRLLIAFICLGSALVIGRHSSYLRQSVPWWGLNLAGVYFLLIAFKMIIEVVLLSPHKMNLRWMEKEKNVSGLIGMLTDEKEGIRSSAAKALGELRDTQAIKPLIALLRDSSSVVREATAEALEQIGSPQVPQMLVESIRPSNMMDMRETIITLLCKIGPISIEPLANVLNNPRLGLLERLLCYSALEQIPGSVITQTTVQEISEATATAIRHNYSRTITVIDDGYYDHRTIPGFIVTAEHQEPDPDGKGIRDLIAWIPTSLIERVRSLSGDAKSYFDD